MDGKQTSWHDHEMGMESCALAGAGSFVLGMTDTAVVVNGPLWCYYYAMGAIEYPMGNVGQRFACTCPSNGAVVFGTEKELRQTLNRVLRSPELPALILVENSCAISLIGDDIKGISREVLDDYFDENPDAEGLVRVVTMDSGGIQGNYWAGYRLGMGKVLEALPPLEIDRDPLTVNLIGCAFWYYNERADIAEMKRILNLLGIKVNCIIGMDHPFRDLSGIGKAALNVVVHPELGLKGAEWLEKRYGIPYTAPRLPYGIAGTDAWVRTIAGCLLEQAGNDEDAREKLREGLERWQAAIERERLAVFDATKDLQRLWGDPWFAEVWMAGPGSVVTGMKAVLKAEWLDTDTLHFVYYDDFDYDDASLVSVHKEPLKPLTIPSPDHLVFGSGVERRLVQQGGEQLTGSIPIARPVSDSLNLDITPFMGLKGNRAMLERIWNIYIFQKQADAL